MSRSLRIALVVPDVRYAWNDERQFRIRRLKQYIGAGEVDLVVFPEGYHPAAHLAAEAHVDGWAEELNSPVLIGLSLDSGFEFAGFRNPNPRPGETSTHFYIKHSTSERLAFEWPDYDRVRDRMFEPISLRGIKLGVQICHDMFFGLIGARLRARGATALIDLTGGGVNLSKWKNIIQARSLELDGPFFCTMARRPGERGAATGIAYTHGRPMRPVIDATRKGGAGGFVVFDAGDEGYEGEDATATQAFSDKIYKDLRIALGHRESPSADVSISIQGGRLIAFGSRPAKAPPGWQGFLTKQGTLGVLLLPLASLTDALAFHRAEPPTGTFDHHLVVYGGGTSQRSPSDIMALLRMRAIEHRIAAAALTPTMREVVKTNRYKNIQRMKGSDGVFGLDANFLGGNFEGTRSGKLGIPTRFMPEYRALFSA